MAEMGLRRSVETRKHAATNSAHGYLRHLNLVVGIQVTQPEQVWVCKLTYIYLCQEFVYLAILIGMFTRRIQGWHLHRGLD